MQLLFPFTRAALTLTLCNSSTMSHFLEIVLQITIKSINLQPVVTLFCFFGQLFSNVTAKSARLSFLNFVSSSLAWGDPGMEFVRGH
jgi:hypothetical protein